MCVMLCVVVKRSLVLLCCMIAFLGEWGDGGALRCIMVCCVVLCYVALCCVVM